MASAPVQPKKAPTAYFMWLAEHREAVAKKIGSSKASDVSKAAGEQWKGLKDEEKAPYEKRAAKEKESYQKAMEEFKNQGGVKAPKKTKKNPEGKVKVKDENAPKKPVGGGYGVFLAEKREDIKKSLPADHKITDVGKKAGEMWQQVSETDKKKYQEQFEEKMKKYKEEMEEYKKTKGAEVEEDGEEEEEVAEETPKKKEAKEPKKRASPKKRAEETPKKKEAKEPKKRASPKKRAAAESSAKAPAAKRGRTAKQTADVADIDTTVLKEAQKLNLEDQLKNLASRPDVKASGKSSRVLLEALKSSKGLVNQAKYAVLGA